MKSLVVYYSYTGNTRYIAKIIAKELGSDLLELKPEKDLIKSKGFMKYFWGGKKVLMKEKPKLKPLDKNPNDYDLVIIGTPVWAWNYTPPIRTFLNKHKLKNKTIGLYCCCMSSHGKIFKNLKKELPNNKFISEQVFIEPLNSKAESKKKAIKWVKNNFSKK